MNPHFKPETYHKPGSFKETKDLLMDAGTIIAGGTDLLVNQPPETRKLVDITGLDLSYIRQDNGVTNIGATTSFAKIFQSPLLDRYPYNVIKESARQVGHHNLRNIATVGGNICNGVPSADSPVALIALDAETVIYGGSERRVPLDGFSTFVRETVLKKGEFLKEVSIPIQPTNTGSSFQKLGRTKVDIALVNAACRITLDEGIIRDSRIVLGAVAPTPIRVREAENILNGANLDGQLVEKASDATASAIKPISDVRASAEYRRQISRVLVKRAINEAYERAMEESA